MNKDYEVVEFQKEYSMLNNRFLKKFKAKIEQLEKDCK